MIRCTHVWHGHSLEFGCEKNHGFQHSCSSIGGSNDVDVILHKHRCTSRVHPFNALLPTEDRFNLVSAQRLIFITSFHSVFLTLINRQPLYKSLRGKVPVKNYCEA